MSHFLSIAYGLTCLLYAFTLLYRFLKWKRAEHGLAVPALMANGLCLGLIAWISGHWPVFNAFESFLVVTFVLGLFGLLFSRPEERLPDLRMWTWIELVLVLCITLFFPRTPSLYLYDHDYLYIVLFHAFRHLALGVMLFASACFIQARIDRKRGVPANSLSHRGRNFLLLSAILFLMGEYVGILWCQNGWGDFWMWSSGFFLSTLIVLYLMLAFHIPGKGWRSDGIRSIIGGLSALVMLTISRNPVLTAFLVV